MAEIVLIAVGLSIDAFAVAVSFGLSVKKAGLKEMAVPGVYFGVFQAIMPIAGYILGISFADKITGVDHWIALALLGGIGGKMIKDSFAKEGEQTAPEEHMFRFTKMLPLAIATSIDALAVGITFALFQVHIFTAAPLIGLITLGISMVGVKIGTIFGIAFKAKAELAGGIVLVALGVKIVLEHTLFGGVH
jgi:putative Mn2+ efflux pump MntP